MNNWASQASSSTLFEDMETLFNSLFDSDVSRVVSKLPQSLVSSTFPPTNMYEEEGILVYEAALAGWSLDEIKLTTENRHMILTLTPSENRVKRDYVQKAIKDSETVARYYVSDKYDLPKLEASYKNGVLKVRIPRRAESLPRDIKIGT